MTDLQKEFESTGRISCVNSDLYPDSKVYTKRYVEWLETKVLALRSGLILGVLPSDEELNEMIVNFAKDLDLSRTTKRAAQFGFQEGLYAMRKICEQWVGAKCTCLRVNCDQWIRSEDCKIHLK